MNFDIPQDIQDFLCEVDHFIENTIKPIEEADDNIRFFDHRREHSRTDWDAGGTPRAEWETLLTRVRNLAVDAGLFNYQLPAELGGRGGSNLGMAIVREHLAKKGLGLHCDLQNEHAVVGNNVCLLLMHKFGSQAQKNEWLAPLTNLARAFAFGISEPEHGSDATHMQTVARRKKDDWLITGVKTWNTGVHFADHDLVLARTSGEAGDAFGITAFLVPLDAAGITIEEYLWTFNMPSDHARVRFENVMVPHANMFGEEGKGLAVIQHFFNENRIRQAASSLGAAQYCIDRSVEYAKKRAPFGKPLATNQAIQFPLVELNTKAEMLRALIHKTAWLMDTQGAFSASDKISMCNYQANRLCCDAADWAMQVHGGLGYSRHTPFEHIYRHHRRYRITEGTDEMQQRRAAGYLFGFMQPSSVKGVD